MIILFLVSLLICIVLHEGAHLVAAKLCKCSVLVFSIGFGKEIFSFNWRGTKYRLALLPLGGYNKLEHELDYCRNKHALPNLTYTKKMFVILAGCAVNIITGLVAMYLAKISFAHHPFIIYYHNYNLLYFGWLSCALGITNLLPIPALDGSYPFFFLLEKIIPKKYALQLTRTLVHWGFLILMAFNVACIPWLIILIKKGAL